MDNEKDQKKDYTGDRKSCGCPVETECDHLISNFQKYCKYNPGAPECKVFDI